MKTLIGALIGVLGLSQTSQASEGATTNGDSFRFSKNRLKREGVNPSTLNQIMNAHGWELNHEEEDVLDFRCFDCASTHLPDDVAGLGVRNEKERNDGI